MYKLSIEFKNLEELTTFVMQQGNGGAVIGAAVESIPPKLKEKEDEAPAKKSNLRTKKEKTPVQEEAVEVQPEQSAPVNEPVVQPKTPRTEAPVTALDRAAAIAKATDLVAKLKASGIADDKLMPEIHAVYQQADCPLNLRISQLENDQLTRFIPLFESKVSEIINPKQNAFI